jgi:hypothetical protein
MVEKAKNKVGRPRGSRNKRRVKPETPPVSAYGASPAQTDEMIEDLAGNGRDGGEYEVSPSQSSQVEAAHDPGPGAPSPTPPLGPQLAKLFIAAVENGYIIRPAYADSYKGAGDNRSWVVGSREELARMVVWLMADRGRTSPDFLDGAVAMPAEAPRVMPQPVEPQYALPIGLRADETAS